MPLLSPREALDVFSVGVYAYATSEVLKRLHKISETTEPHEFIAHIRDARTVLETCIAAIAQRREELKLNAEVSAEPVAAVRAEDTRDNSGRPYAKLSDLNVGDVVQVDDGFTCIPAWEPRIVLSDTGGLYIFCSGEAGDEDRIDADHMVERHYLAGQLDADGDTLVGIYAEVIQPEETKS